MAQQDGKKDTTKITITICAIITIIVLGWLYVIPLIKDGSSASENKDYSSSTTEEVVESSVTYEKISLPNMPNIDIDSLSKVTNQTYDYPDNYTSILKEAGVYSTNSKFNPFHNIFYDEDRGSILAMYYPNPNKTSSSNSSSNDDNNSNSNNSTNSTNNGNNSNSNSDNTYEVSADDTTIPNPVYWSNEGSVFHIDKDCPDLIDDFNPKLEEEERNILSGKFTESGKYNKETNKYVGCITCKDK